MNPDRLLAHYHRIADAPDAIPRLRELIFRLAIRGRLLPSQVPWTATTLGDVGRWGSGGTPLKTHPEYYGGDVPWLVIGDLNDGLVTSAETFITKAGLENSSCKLIEPGTLLIAMYGSIGKLGVAGIQCATNQAIAHCTPNTSVVLGEYLLLILRGLRRELLTRGQGVAQQNISQKILKAQKVDMPPLAEQHRIVAKVDELMALCDRLEAARAKREATRDRLTIATLARINAVRSANFYANARFVVDTLAKLLTRPTQVAHIRQTIFDLAVAGRVVPQNRDDEPAPRLLQRISAAKRQAGEAPVVRRDANETDLPSGWCATSLGDYAIGVFTGPFGSALHKSDYTVGGIPLVNPSHMRNDHIIPDPKIAVSPSTAKRLESYALQPDDLVLARRGEIGRAALVEPHQGGWLCGTGSFFLRFTEEVNRRFLLLVLKSSGVRAFLAGAAVGTTMVNLNHGILKRTVLWIPPSAEQQRIVARVDELMTLCGQLETSLAEGDEARRKLLEALLHEALEAEPGEAA